MNNQFWNLWSSYAIYYFGKVNLSIVIPALLITYGDLAYAIGQFLHGQISERFNPYLYIALGLVLSGIANMFMGFIGSFFVMLLVLETFDGWF